MPSTAVPRTKRPTVPVTVRVDHLARAGGKEPFFADLDLTFSCGVHHLGLTARERLALLATDDLDLPGHAERFALTPCRIHGIPRFRRWGRTDRSTPWPGSAASGQLSARGTGRSRTRPGCGSFVSEVGRQAAVNAVRCSAAQSAKVVAGRPVTRATVSVTGAAVPTEPAYVPSTESTRPGTPNAPYWASS